MRSKGPVRTSWRSGSWGRSAAAGLALLWVDLTGDLDAVRELQERIEMALDALGFAREARGLVAAPYAGACAAGIGREKSRGVIEPAIAAVSAPSGVIPVREVSLMRSTLRPSGAVYERVAAFPLGGA